MFALGEVELGAIRLIVVVGLSEDTGASEQKRCARARHITSKSDTPESNAGRDFQ